MTDRPPICLITPPSVFLLDQRVFAALGILKIAAVLEDAGHVVEHVDLSGIENYEDAIRAHAARSEAVHFGITATTPQMTTVNRIASVLRETRPDARLILGGPHPTLENAARKYEQKIGTRGRATKEFEALTGAFDTVVCGDGEDAIFHAIMPDAPKAVDADEVASALFLTNDRLDRLPMPARHLVDMGSYHYTIEGHPSVSLIAQLGCPFQCGFCGGRESPMLRRIRTRSIENIVAEVVHLYQTYGYTGFMFYDDELNVNKGMVGLMDALADAQRRLGVEFRLRGFVKSHIFTDEQAAAMYRAGFRWILVGFESGSPRILDNIRKMATREQNSECMAIARRHGLKVKALMSIGHPGESEQTVRETKEWLLEERPADFDCTIISTYAGTPYHDRAVETQPGVWTYTAKSGDRLHSYEVDYSRVANFYKGDPNDGYRSYVFTDHLSAEQLVALRDDLERDVRAKLNIPFNPGQPGIRFEASMGQFSVLPSNILRTTGVETVHRTVGAGTRAVKV